MQAPPPVSAKKVDGVRAYRLARQHLPVDLPPSPVHIHELSLLDAGTQARSASLGSPLFWRHRLRPVHRPRFGPSLGIRCAPAGVAAVGLLRIHPGPSPYHSPHNSRNCPRRRTPCGSIDSSGSPDVTLTFLVPLRGIAHGRAKIRQGRTSCLARVSGKAGSSTVKAVSNDGELIAYHKRRHVICTTPPWCCSGKLLQTRVSTILRRARKPTGPRFRQGRASKTNGLEIT